VHKVWAGSESAGKPSPLS